MESLRGVLRWLFALDQQYVAMLHPARVTGLQTDFAQDDIREVHAISLEVQTELVRASPSPPPPKPTAEQFAAVHARYPVLRELFHGWLDNDDFLARTRISGDKEFIPCWRDMWSSFQRRHEAASRPGLPFLALRFGTLDQVHATLHLTSPTSFDRLHTVVRVAACCRGDPAVLQLVLARGFDPTVDNGLVVAMLRAPDPHTEDRLALLLPLLGRAHILRHTDTFVHRRRKRTPPAEPLPHPCDIAARSGHRRLCRMIAARLLELHLQSRR